MLVPNDTPARAECSAWRGRFRARHDPIRAAVRSPSRNLTNERGVLDDGVLDKFTLK